MPYYCKLNEDGRSCDVVNINDSGQAALSGCQPLPIGIDPHTPVYYTLHGLTNSPPDSVSASMVNRQIDAKIAALEAKTFRPIREILLIGIDAVDSRAKLKSIDDEIAVLRSLRK